MQTALFALPESKTRGYHLLRDDTVQSRSHTTPYFGQSLWAGFTFAKQGSQLAPICDQPKRKRARKNSSRLPRLADKLDAVP